MWHIYYGLVVLTYWLGVMSRKAILPGAGKLESGA
jgi:hypothetical protein